LIAVIVIVWQRPDNRVPGPGSPWDSPFRKKQVAHLHFRFVQLGFRITDRTIQHLRDFMMLIALDLMQGENLPAALGEFLHNTAQCNAVDRTAEVEIRLADIAPERRRL
jgi:hypothetical protein